jgi:hypothetical protein
VVLAAIYFYDAIWAGQGMISLVVGLVGVLLGAAALWSALRGDRALMRSRLIRCGMCLIVAAVAVVTVRWHAATAAGRAENVIAAVRRYESAHGALPPDLTALVPEHLPSIPRAKRTMRWNEFTYQAASSGESHTLMYVAFPPFGRLLYSFEQDEWTQLD